MGRKIPLFLCIAVACMAASLYASETKSDSIHALFRLKVGPVGAATPLSIATIYAPTSNSFLNLATEQNLACGLEFYRQNRLAWRIANNGSSGLDRLDFYNNDVRLCILQNGCVGIGVIDPQSKLQVDGEIKCTKLKINSWAVEAPDYVFSNGYKLRSLDDIEKFIAANKHLPEAPSSGEIKANGVDVQEMNMLLLKKVEELTLYVIEQQKRIEALETKAGADSANVIPRQLH
jgi:hypothetical protein